MLIRVFGRSSAAYKGLILRNLHWAKSCLPIFERCWEDQLSTTFQNFRKLTFQIWWKTLEDCLSTSFDLSEDELLYFSNISKDELTNLLKYVENSSSNNFLLFERRTSPTFKSFEIWAFDFSKRCRKLIYRRLSTFRKMKIWKEEFTHFFYKIGFNSN